MTGTRRWGTTLGGTVLVLALGAPAVLALSPDERQRLEQRVAEMEQALRAHRDEALVRCRGQLANCRTKTCGKIPEAETGPWQQCQDSCEASYAACQARARAIWPEEP